MSKLSKRRILAKERFTKNLWSERSSSRKPQLVAVRDEVDQARYVTEQVLANREKGSLLKGQAVAGKARGSRMNQAVFHNRLSTISTFSKFCECQRYDSRSDFLPWRPRGSRPGERRGGRQKGTPRVSPPLGLFPSFLAGWLVHTTTPMVFGSQPSQGQRQARAKKKTARFGRACAMEKIGRRQRLETAHREAAHCIAAIAQGLSVQLVSLHPVDNHAAGAHLDRAIYLAADNPDAQIEALKTDIIVMLAGPAAQMRLRPSKRNHLECGDDFKLARAWATLAAFLASGMSIAEFVQNGKIELSEEEQAFADRLIDECERRARQIIEERWAQITTIAEALLDRTQLNADDIDALLENRRDHTLRLLLGRKP
jgi:hypothetical protein